MGPFGQLRRRARRVARSLLSWASFACIPIGMVVAVSGFQTLGGLLIVGGILAYFLVDPIMFLLDLGSGAYTWRTPNGTRYSNFAVVHSVWGLRWFQSTPQDPNSLTGLVLVRARIGTARLFVPGFPWPRIYFIVDANTGDGQCP